jgi:hypothetical protein
VARDIGNVFVNVPFDDAYAPLFDALVFAIMACGYRVRCALEADDSGDIRLDKLVTLIRESPRSIHDLSRIDLGENDLPRFNMPFELGLAMGAKRFGGPSRRRDLIKVMVEEPYRLPAYLSDLGGNDPTAHHAEPANVIRIVRNFLHRAPKGGMLAGPAKLARDFSRFRTELPEIAERIDFEPDEIGGLRNYPTYVWCVAEFLRSGPAED